MGAEEDDDDDILDDGGEGKPVPYHRFQRLAQSRREARRALKERNARIAELEQQLGTANTTAERVTQLEAELEEWRRKESGWAEERALLAAGVKDEEGVRFVRLAWSQVDKAERPKGGLTEWLQKRDELPQGVRVYLPEADAGDQGGQQQQQRGGAPNVNARARVQTEAPKQLQPGNVYTGRKEYAANRANVFGALGGDAPRYPWQKQDRQD